MKCPTCHAELPPGALLCPICRDPASMDALGSRETDNPGSALPGPTGPTGPTDPTGAGPAFIGPYRIIRELGRGGMGVVYEAEQQQPRRPVALKVLHGTGLRDELRIRLFQREVHALARLKHPNIAIIHESGQTSDGRHFFAMELIRGVTLNAALAQENRRGRLTQEQLRHRFQLFRRICDAVNYAHQRGIIHRDLKPSNILVPRAAPSDGVASSSAPEVKVLDFGLAYITDPDKEAGSLVTSAGQVCGTLAYMSPEQIRGNPDEVDIRADVYSLGAILFEMLTGRLPIDISRASVPEAARRVCEDPPAPLARDWLGIRKPPSDLQTIVTKALEKEPHRRYQSAAALSEDIDRFLNDQPVLARKPGAFYQLRKMIARHKVVFGFSGALALLISGSAVLMTILSARLAVERDRAAREAARATAINQFLLDTMGAANPIEGRGRDITVLQALRLAADRVDSSFAGQPEVDARVRYTIGVTYLRLGEYADAEAMIRSAIDRLPLAAGADSSELVEPLSALGVLRHERGDYAAAEAIYRQARALKKRLHPAADADEMGLVSDLALVLEDQGKLAEAEELLRQVLDYDRAALGPSHINVALDLANLGNLLARIGRYDQSEAMQRQSVAIMRGANSAWLGPILGNLGECLLKAGRPREAQTVLEEGVSRGLADLGDRNQDVAKSRMKYAECLLELGERPRAEAEAAAAFDVFRSSFGEANEWTRRARAVLVSLQAVDGEGRSPAREAASVTP